MLKSSFSWPQWCGHQGWKMVYFWSCRNIQKMFPWVSKGYDVFGSEAKPLKAFVIETRFSPKIPVSFCHFKPLLLYSFSIFCWQHACMPKSAIFSTVNDMESAEFRGSAGYFHPWYILAKGTITITGAGADAEARNTDTRNKQVTFQNQAPFTNCASQINNTHVDNVANLDIVMPMHNLIDYLQ